MAVHEAVDGGPARTRRHQAEQHAQGGGLAGAVRAEEADHVAPLDREGEPVDGDQVPEAFGHVVELDHCHSCLAFVVSSFMVLAFLVLASGALAFFRLISMRTWSSTWPFASSGGTRLFAYACRRSRPFSGYARQRS